MFSKSLIAISALVGSALAQTCPEVNRFGTLKFPNPIVLGQAITFQANYTCARELGFGPVVYGDFFLQVPESNNTGFQPPIYFARRSPSGDEDTFTVTFDPTYVGFTTYPDAQYQIVQATTHAAQSDSYGTTLTTGEIFYPVSVVQASN
ncbi:hypothetical protein GYMLUDRAFT_68730 [Collybiopsis luxurians FD-317 M1]|nr:hypothetical protein GYMLUDRAFT_68730 [Collybiopsis luxurians FD-317 M1]